MYLSHVPHDGILLCVDEALEHNSYGHVDVITVNVLPQVHSSVSLGDPDDRFNVTYCYGNATSPLHGKE